jgi:hypothetical protein
MGILFTILLGIPFTITMGFLFTITLGIQFTVSRNPVFLTSSLSSSLSTWLWREPPENGRCDTGIGL